MGSGKSQAIFVQPHLDDVAFACGGTVARSAERGEHPIVLGVFCGPPPADQPLSATAQSLHAKWGLGDDAWLARRQEDERACTALGATPRWLDHSDCPYRGYSSFTEMFSGMRDDDPLVERVATDLRNTWRETSDATMYLPLGIGGHVDHLLTHAAGALLEREGISVVYYEDFPYAAIGGMVSARLAALGAAFRAEIHEIGPWIDQRIQASAAYVSQVTGLFTATSLVAGPLETAVRRHASAIAMSLPGFVAPGSRLAEVFYRRDGRP